MPSTTATPATGTPSLYVGVDNGISGALTALSHHGQLVGMTPMPSSKARKGNEVDVSGVWTWLREITGDNMRDVTLVIEEPGGSKSAQAAGSMSGSFQSIRAICIIKGIRLIRITPQKWQHKMLPKCKQGDTKPRALALARELWPDESWLASNRCRTPHDGMIDAALIAEWARRERI